MKSVLDALLALALALTMTSVLAGRIQDWLCQRATRS